MLNEPTNSAIQKCFRVFQHFKILSKLNTPASSKVSQNFPHLNCHSFGVVISPNHFYHIKLIVHPMKNPMTNLQYIPLNHHCFWISRVYTRVFLTVSRPHRIPAAGKGHHWAPAWHCAVVSPRPVPSWRPREFPARWLLRVSGWLAAVWLADVCVCLYICRELYVCNVSIYIYIHIFSYISTHLFQHG